MSTGTVKIEIRILPNSDTFDVDLPLDVTVGQIIEEFKSSVPGISTEHTYHLMAKGSKYNLDSGATLATLGVKDGDILFMAPDAFAG